jgi:hypothetical protein
MTTHNHTHVYTVKPLLMNTSHLWTMNTIFGPDSTENLYIMNDYFLTVDQTFGFTHTCDTLIGLIFVRNQEDT